MKHLPAAAQHVPFRPDLGLFVDGCFCLVAYGLVAWVDRRPSRPRGKPGSR